ncbi:MAG: flagella basal body P-ring formation protein FlgA [Planctomycetota bacterium]|nr:MAG: flagella basal body P-ring formation protein FlgA [Planctomycetota bacterium]
MLNRTIGVILIVFLLTSVGSAAGIEQEDSALRIHLPREITIDGNIPNLARVAVIRGNESLVSKAGKVTLGRISVPGQKIIVDRSIVLSRLAHSGIGASRVTFTGAEKITVSRRHQIVKGGEFAEAALAFLKKNPPDDSICQFDAVGAAKDLILPGESKDIKLSARLVKSSARNLGKVRVAALCDGKETGSRELTFRFKYNSRRLVAQVDIPPGTVISPENVKVEKVISNYPSSADLVSPYGLVARRLLPAKTVIRPGMTGPARPKVLVKRHQNVVIRISTFGLLVTANGKTMQEGRLGEYIKVQNADSQRVILARVNEDGSVEPVF